MSSKKKSFREKQIYNEAIRDAMKELWLYDGVIPDEAARAHLCRKIQEDRSYKIPALVPLILIN